MNNDLEKEKEMAAIEAAKLIKNEQIVGLGTGSTAFYVVKEVGRMVKAGLKIRCVPTSNKTAELASSVGISLVDINEVELIDITIDGADEFNEQLVLIKGGGGALMREKIVASMTKQEIIIADSTKKVETLGKFPLPIEVIPYAANFVIREVAKLNGTGKVRIKDNLLFVTDSGNHIVDVDFGLIDDPASLANKLNTIVGVVCHGLFIGLTKMVIMGDAQKNSTVEFM